MPWPYAIILRGPAVADADVAPLTALAVVAAMMMVIGMAMMRAVVPAMAAVTMMTMGLGRSRCQCEGEKQAHADCNFLHCPCVSLSRRIMCDRRDVQTTWQTRLATQ